METDVIHINPNILGGVQDFSTVSREQIIQVLSLAEKLLTSQNLKSLYENID